MRERRKRGERTRIGELLLRLNYMASIFWASLFVLCLMIIPFNGHLVSPLTYAVAIPYFVAMAIDLKYCGYKYFDAARIYGFNLLLLPVNLAGSVSSMVQALTGAKGKFMRTPKVRNRTVPAFIYVVLPYLLVAWSVYTFKVAYEHDLWSNAVFAAINGVLGAYAIVAFIGVRDSIVDIWVNVVSWLYKPQGPKKMAARAPAAIEPTDDGVANWELVLYLGHADRRRRSRETPEAASDLDRAPADPAARPDHGRARPSRQVPSWRPRRGRVRRRRRHGAPRRPRTAGATAEAAGCRDGRGRRERHRDAGNVAKFTLSPPSQRRDRL